MKSNGWKHNPKTKLVVGTETNPTKLESGQVVINKKATKQNLDRLIEINNDGLDKPIKKEVTTDGTEGGLLKGKPHYDKNGNSLGGIPAVVDGAKNIETEGEEFLLNREASQKHWKELSKINQSAGNGVPINPSDVGADEDPEEFRDGGTAKIEFNPNHIPSKWIYSYAKKIKEKYPKVWDMGGNIFGNEAFNNLERVLKRGYWTDNEEWMYIKWRSYVARHHKDFRIAGTVAMLKWVDKTDKGWDYMKDLIDKEVAKKYPKKGFKTKMKTGGEVVTYKNKYNKKYGYDENESHDLKEIAKDTDVSVTGLQQIYNKGIGAYKTNPQSVRPNVKSKEQWAMARVYSAVMGGKAAKVDSNELKMAKGGGFEFTSEKKGTLIRGNEIIKYFEKVNGNYRLVFYTLNETKGKVPTICNSFGYCKELDTDNVTSKQLVKLIKKNNLMEYGGVMEGQPPANFENVLYRELANRYEKGGLTTTDNIKVSGFNHYQKTKKNGKFYKLYANKHINNDEVENWWIFFTIKDGVKDLGIIRYRFENEKKDIYKEMVIYFNDLPNSLKEVYNNISETYKEGGNIENSDLTEMTLNRVYSGEINSDDAAIKLDESGIEVDHDLYERLRDAEKSFLNKNRGLQVGDTITVKGKHGNSDFKGNFRGFTNEGKLVVVYGGGNQMVIGRDDYYEIGGNVKDEVEMISTKYLDSIRTQDKSNWNYELEKSIENKGVIEPVIISYYPEDNLLALTDGHNRLDTAVDLGIEKIPAKLILRYDNPIGKIKVYKSPNYNPNAKKPSDLGIYGNGGTTDDFDWESLLNPSPEEQEKIKQEIKKSEEQEKEDWYQNSRFSKKWAATYQDAVNRTVKEYLDAKATYDDWASRQYKQNKGMVFLGGDDVFGEAKSIGSINEGRRQRVLRGAKMQMDESIETLKELRLTDKEISNLLQNKMAKGGITEIHEDLESKIYKEQFGHE